MRSVGREANKGQGTFVTGELNGVHVIICASSSRLDIYDEFFVLHQSILISNFSSDIKSPVTSIAAAQGRTVYFFEPNLDSALDEGENLTLPKWINTTSIIHDYAISCIQWKSEDALFTGGQKLALYVAQENEETSSREWKLGDRLVKIWFSSISQKTVLESGKRSQRDYDHTFLYLPHPQPIVNADWRRDPNGKYDDLALMTTSEDRVARIWLCSVPDYKFYPRFEMRCCLDLYQDSTPHESSLLQIVHWLNPEEVRGLIELRAAREDRLIKSRRKSGTSVKRGKKLMDSTKEYATMIFSIAEDGSLSIWGLQYLERSANRVPRLLLILKINDAVRESSTIYFHKSQLFARKSKLLRSATYFPPELLLIGQSFSGSLGSFSLNLDDFFGSPWACSTLKEEYFWSFPSADISLLEAEESCSLVAALSKGQQLSVFAIEKQTSSAPHLTLVGTLNSEDILGLTWLPKNRKIAIYQVDPNRITKISETVVLQSSPIQSINASRLPDNGFYLLDVAEAVPNHEKSWSLGTILSDVDDIIQPPLGSDTLNLFLTLSEATLKLWLLSSSNGTNPKWTCIYQKGFEKDLRDVVTGPFGKIALWTIGENDGDEIVLWGYNALEPGFFEHHKLKLDSEVVGMSFSRNLGGYNKFAVATMQSIQIYQEVNSSMEDQSCLWKHVNSFQLRGAHGFNQEKAQALSSILQHRQLPSLSQSDKLKLSAIANTVAQVDQAKRALDESGSRFLVSSRLFLLEKQNGSISDETLSNRDIAWAFFSESEDILFDLSNGLFEGKMLWKDARSLGVGLWLKNPDLLKRTIETIARNIYMSKEDKDPIECSLFYIVLRKKNVLLGLWKLASAHQEQNAMLKFLANDFNEDRWQKAAAKNAFALLGKQRYEYAAAFFLLANKLKDAVNVCLKQLNDVQLAIVLCRIYEGENGPVLNEILQNVLIEEGLKTNDRWIVCMAKGILKDYNGALSALVGNCGSQAFVEPSLYSLYLSLKRSFKKRRLPVTDISPRKEAELFYRCAMAYDFLGCPTLAIKVMEKIKIIPEDIVKPPVSETLNIANSAKQGLALQRAEDFDWSSSASKADKASEMDWSAPSSKLEKASDIDWSTPVAKTDTSTEYDWGAPVASTRPPDNDEYEAFKKSTLGVENKEDIDWGAPVGKANTSNFDDDYEAFKKSLMGDTVDETFDDEIEEAKLEKMPSTTSISGEVLDSPKDVVSRAQLQAMKWILGLKVASLVPTSVEEVSLKQSVFQGDSILNEFTDSLKTGITELENAVITLLLSIIRYHDLAGTAVSPELWPVISQATASAVIVLTCSAISISDYRTLWWIAGLSDKLFMLLAGGGKKSELWPLLSDLLNAHPESGSEDHSDDEYDNEVVLEKQNFSKLVLEAVLLQHVAFDFEVFVTHTKENANFSAQSDLSEMALLGISGRIFNLQEKMGQVGKRGRKISATSIQRSLVSDEQKHLWSLLRRSTNLVKMIDFATGLIKDHSDLEEAVVGPTDEVDEPDSNKSSPQKPSPSPLAPSPKQVSHEEVGYEVVFNADNIIGSFAINPLDSDSIAVATHDQVVEIDVTSSLSYYKRRESFAERRESVDDLAVKQIPFDFDREGRSGEHSTKVPRNLSYDSLERALKRSMTSLRKQDLAAHLDATGEAVVKLFQYSQQRELVSYTTGCSARITKCRFDPFGIRFGACDTKGELHLWKFDSSEQALKPALNLACNTAITNDFTFLNCSTLLATAGVSTSGNNVALWDTLLPSTKSKVKSFGTESGAYSTVYSGRHNILLVGTKKGDILLFDIRQQTMRKSFHAHASVVKALAIDAENDCLVSGSAGGDVKLWDMTQFEETETYDKLHTGPASKNYNEIFGGMTTYGVMQIAVYGGHTFTCGADGSLRKSK
ncbi:regulator of (H+)-ATPase in vacuolar membrane [Phlyctochytrium planicorne]|nr:regulator of (H+)-ATPase in vacuolar membrane [Phlyctochytrium planicorne]